MPRKDFDDDRTLKKKRMLQSGRKSVKRALRFVEAELQKHDPHARLRKKKEEVKNVNQSER